MSHWRRVSAGEAVRHRLYGIQEMLGVFLTGLTLEPFVLIPLSLAVVVDGTFGGGYLIAGEVALGLSAWLCARLLARVRPTFVRVYRWRAVAVALWSTAIWSAIVAPAAVNAWSGVDAVALFGFFAFVRLVMTVLYTAYTFVSERLNVTLLHRVHG